MPQTVMWSSDYKEYDLKDTESSSQQSLVNVQNFAYKFYIAMFLCGSGGGG